MNLHRSNPLLLLKHENTENDNPVSFDAKLLACSLTKPVEFLFLGAFCRSWSLYDNQ